MSATPTFTTETVDLGYAAKAQLDGAIRALYDALERADDNDTATISTLGEELMNQFVKGYTMLDHLLLVIDNLVRDRDRLASMSRHPAGKGRCHCIQGPRSV